MSNQLKEKLKEILLRNNLGLLPDEAERQASIIMQHYELIKQAEFELEVSSNHPYEKEKR